MTAFPMAPDLSPGYPSRGEMVGPLWNAAWALLLARDATAQARAVSSAEVMQHAGYHNYSTVKNLMEKARKAGVLDGAKARVGGNKHHSTVYWLAQGWESRVPAERPGELAAPSQRGRVEVRLPLHVAEVPAPLAEELRQQGRDEAENEFVNVRMEVARLRQQTQDDAAVLTALEPLVTAWLAGRLTDRPQEPHVLAGAEADSPMGRYVARVMAPMNGRHGVRMTIGGGYFK